jgi:hypothetical protein
MTTQTTHDGKAGAPEHDVAPRLDVDATLG